MRALCDALGARRCAANWRCFDISGVSVHMSAFRTAACPVLAPGALAVRKPRVATRVVGVVTGAASVASAFAAYGVVKATRLVQQLEVAAKALPAAEQ